MVVRLSGSARARVGPGVMGLSDLHAPEAFLLTHLAPKVPSDGTGNDGPHREEETPQLVDGDVASERNGAELSLPEEIQRRPLQDPVLREVEGLPVGDQRALTVRQREAAGLCEDRSQGLHRLLHRPPDGHALRRV